MRNHPDIYYATASISASVIDVIGIQKATRITAARALSRLTAALNPRTLLVLLDGLLYAPKQYYQKTIIKGDEKEPAIMMASIIAKVTRDRKMLKLGKQYPEYCLEKHKGYGTYKHIAAIKRHGLSPIHRRSFCTNLTK